MQDYLNNSRFVRIINSDNYCLFRAILIGKAFADKEKNAYLLDRQPKKFNLRVKEFANLFFMWFRNRFKITS